MKNIFYTLVILITSYSCTPKNEWKLVWADEFDNIGLPDSSKWSFATDGNSWAWGNNELQWYTDKNTDNAEVSGGVLKIKALHHKTGDTSNFHTYTSARLISKLKGDWKYGKIEVRAKLPVGNGTWPAIWMMPTKDIYGGWPKSGEIDIMEHVGYQPNEIFSTVHTAKYNHLIGTQVGKTIIDSTLTTNFHTFTLEWEETELRSYLDGVKFFSFSKESGSEAWPFDQEFYLILNIAIGGGLGGKMGVDDALFPHIMEVDYVRVYQKKEK